MIMLTSDAKDDVLERSVARVTYIVAMPVSNHNRSYTKEIDLCIQHECKVKTTLAFISFLMS